MPSTRRLDQGLLRMLDANLNRASEGLRAAEDVLRFVRLDAKRSGEARALRHLVRRTVLGVIPAGHLLEARDSAHDPGRGRWQAARRSTRELLAANLRRAQESARVLEEGLRLAGRPAAVRAMQAVRYRLYRLESAAASVPRR
ncbi:MAG: thiamine-phosphate pyrophosphorylase [Candidatus Coatesbacteria bacterium]